MSCCDFPRAADAQFGPKLARKDMVRYLKKGPDGTTQCLLDLIRDTGMTQATLLDIGAGIGVIHHELVDGTVARAIHVEASPSYIAEASREAEQRGHTAALRFIEGDATELADAMPMADLATLDRVICCYPNWESLVTHSAAKTRRYYGFSVPRDRWSVRLAVALQNLLRRVRGSTFRTYVHSLDAIDRKLADLGFRRVSVRNSFVWHAALYTREN